MRRPARPKQTPGRPSGSDQAEPPFKRNSRHPGGEAREPAATRLRAAPDLALIWGFHAGLEALRSPRRTILRVLASEAAAERLGPALLSRRISPDIVPPAELDAILPRDAVHQGVVVQARPLEVLDLSDVPETGTVLVLDQITDPHNVGAILRTAAAFGVSALVTTERHAPEMTGVLAKAASGGLEHVPVVNVVNLARALDDLADRGFQVVGLDSEGSIRLDEVQPAGALALVLGAEGKGLRRLTRERCEVVARLDMPGAIKSLNVSNACAVALAVLRLRAGPCASAAG